MKSVNVGNIYPNARFCWAGVWEHGKVPCAPKGRGLVLKYVNSWDGRTVPLSPLLIV